MACLSGLVTIMSLRTDNTEFNFVPYTAKPNNKLVTRAGQNRDQRRGDGSATSLISEPPAILSGCTGRSSRRIL